MKVKTFTLSIALLFIFINISYSQYNYELNTIIESAIDVSPKIKMLQAKFKAVNNGIPQQSNLPDPIVSIGLVNMPVNSFSFTQEPMTGKMISLSQGIPFPGKLSTISKTASYDLEVIHKMIDEEKNSIKKEIQILYTNYHSVHNSLILLREKAELLRSVREVVLSNYATGKVNQQNIFAVDLNITKLENKIVGLESSKQVALEKIRTTLLDPTFTINGMRALDAQTPFSTSLDELTIFAREHRPLLKQSKIFEQKAISMKELAEYEYYPDFNFKLQYSQRDRIASTGSDLNDFLSVIVGFNIPINYGGKKNAKIEEAISFKEYYTRQYSSLLLNIQIELSASLQRIQSYHKQINLLDDTQRIQAIKNYESALASYQVDKIEFINVIDAVNNIIDVEIDSIDLKQKLLIEKFNISYLIGYEL